MTNKRLEGAQFVEKVAEEIYLNEGGFDPETYESVLGKKKRIWKTDAPWDSQSDIELCEHERDEYRFQARAALEVLAGQQSPLSTSSRGAIHHAMQLHKQYARC